MTTSETGRTSLLTLLINEVFQFNTIPLATSALETCRWKKQSHSYINHPPKFFFWRGETHQSKDTDWKIQFADKLIKFPTDSPPAEHIPCGRDWEKNLLINVNAGTGTIRSTVSSLFYSVSTSMVTKSSHWQELLWIKQFHYTEHR